MKQSNKKNNHLVNHIGAYVRKHDISIVLYIWFASLWSWVLFTDTLDLAGNKRQGQIIALCVLVFNTALLVFISKKIITVVNYIFKQFSIYYALLLALPVFAFMDFLLAWIPATLWIGPQGRLDSLLPMSNPSLLAINTPLVFASRIIGFFGIGGFVWLTAYLAWNKRLRKYSLLPLLALSIFSLIGWAVWKTPNGSKFTATVVSESLAKRVPSVKEQGSSLVVFPEYGLDGIKPENIKERLESANQDTVYFLGSEQVIQPNRVGHLNRLLYGNTKDGITFKQDKYRLIPGGEDLPFILRTALRATNQKSTLDYFSSAKGTLKGPKQLQPFALPNNTLVGAAVCSSIISPNDYRSFARNGSTIFTNSASLTIFKGSPLFAWQQKSFAQFMAVANSRYFLQSANSARAYILDNNGRTITEASGHTVLTRQVQNNTKKTLYTTIGEVLVWAGALICLVFAVQKLKKWKDS